VRHTGLNVRPAICLPGYLLLPGRLALRAVIVKTEGVRFGPLDGRAQDHPFGPLLLLLLHGVTAARASTAFILWRVVVLLAAPCARARPACGRSPPAPGPAPCCGGRKVLRVRQRRPAHCVSFAAVVVVVAAAAARVPRRARGHCF
jgi:hypothetical protein